MKKEVVIAIIGGFILGLIITFGIATAQRSLKSNKNSTSTTNESLPLPPPTPVHTLFITSPQPNSVLTDTNLMVSGSTTPLSMVSIITTSNQNTAVADAQGNFAFPIMLNTGANILEVTSFDAQGNQTAAQFTVVVIPHSEQAVPTPTTAKTR